MTPAWPTLFSFLALCIPLVYGLAAFIVRRTAPFRPAVAASYVAMGLGAVVAAIAAFSPYVAPQWTTGSALGHVVRLDAVTGVMIVLVCAIALVIVRYSRTYLHRDPGQPRYARALLGTLAAVTTLVIANNLIIIALAWTGTSLALHQLLTYYRERPEAQVAAHKKFILSRLADVCVYAALGLLWSAIGSLQLDELYAWVLAQPALPVSVHVATALLVLAISMRAAQLPFHGWLTQVMEAPTPISALLHAGVVNIGGFLLIRLAPLMVNTPVAQGLLIAVGLTTTVLAALIMTTRVSVKVGLAWSTSAQMGLMLVQCGLGAYDLALLHLVAHSLYKAHAFLSSGTAVDVWRIQSIAPRRRLIPVARVVTVAVALVGGIAAVGAGMGFVLGRGFGLDPAMAALAVILGTSLAPLVATVVDRGWRPLGTVLGRAAGVAALYFGWHAAFAQVLTPPVEPSAIGWAVVAAGFVVLFGLQVALQSRPESTLSRELRPRLFAGLYLDELFTRMTFRLWPPQLPPRPAPMSKRLITETAEA